MVKSKKLASQSKACSFGQDGFSLLEVLIALVISTVAFMAMTSVSLQVVRGNETSQDLLEASILAQNAMETLKGKYFDLGVDLDDSSDDEFYETENKVTATEALTDCDATNNDLSPEDSWLQPDHYWDDAGTLINCASPGALVGNQDYLVTWVIEDDAPIIGMKVIAVVVGWSTQKGVAGKADNYLTLYSAIQGR